MTACSTRSAARKVRSITWPVRALRSVVRTKAPPLPGFTCWKSTTENRPSGRSRLMPFFRSLVVIAMRVSLRGRGLRGRGEDPAARAGDDHRVLDADASVLGEVHARLDGHDVAGLEGTSGRRRHPGVLVDLEPHAVAG